MSIDPRTLAVQRAVIAGEAIPAHRHLGHLRLVKRDPRISCECGTCRTCKKREGMRRFRAGIRAELGPKRDLGRKCGLCGDSITDTNRSGFCSPCQKHHKADCDKVRTAIFADGGGI